MGRWIQTFKGRNHSWAIDVNFLWNTENIYIMDNHRAALWCWLQHIKPNSKFGLFHIDAHYDAAATIIDDEIKNLPDLTRIEFNDYLGISFKNKTGKKCPLIRWDNYLYLYHNFPLIQKPAKIPFSSKNRHRQQNHCHIMR